MWFDSDSLESSSTRRSRTDVAGCMVSAPIYRSNSFVDSLTILAGWRGGATVGRRTSGREAVGSIPGRAVAA